MCIDINAETNIVLCGLNDTGKLFLSLNKFPLELQCYSTTA